MSSIYHLQKNEKYQELEYEALGRTFTKTDPDSFYISNNVIIIERFNGITLMRQDINEKENKIRNRNNRLETLSDVFEGGVKK